MVGGFSGGNDAMNNNLIQDNQNDYDEVDYRICGELGNPNYLNLLIIEEKNRALDEFVAI